MNDISKTSAKQFNATLLPYRSLSRKGFVVLMAIVCVISFVAGAVFVWMGAWPVTGFFGLDVALIYWAFRANYRAADMYEKVELDATELRITRVQPSGHSESWSFNPYWVRLGLEERETSADVLSITSHGARFVFGAFLSDAEKKEFLVALRSALAVHGQTSS
ncbi:MAG: DUF2244 domain-containing protein [Hyphomicrobiales bacterium]|nr:DUF2244 domain-containing protein [Hyphomicrobiales bacterium]